MSTPDQVLAFWLDEVGPNGWYKGSRDLDARVREKFETTWQNACEGTYSMWLTYPTGTLAYIILMDQLPRNMFRGSAQAFSSDKAALEAAKCAIFKGWDLKVDEPARQFFYLPLMHSESLTDQDHCVRLMLTRLPETGAGNLLHAKVHREVIRRYGRFPHRNSVLDRKDTEPEYAFFEQGGYGAMLQEFTEAA